MGENARFNGAIAQLQGIIRDIIRQRVADVAAEKAGGDGGDGGRRDLLTRMVQESNNMGLNWTEDDMLGHVSVSQHTVGGETSVATRTNRTKVLTFLAAGHETTSNSIAWAIHYLAVHQELQARLRAEIIAKGNAPNMEYAEIESMRVLDNLYHEVLRVRSGGKINHVISRDAPKIQTN